MTTGRDTRWPPGTTDPIGQAGEFLVWVELIVQSGGGLHPFLPMLDRGIDALIHRLRDGAYLALQVKAKTYFESGEAPIAVYENHLFTDDQLVVGVPLEGDHLGPFTLVADAVTFRRKAGRLVDRGRTMLVADIPIRPTPGHKWSEDLVPTDRLAERVGAGLPLPAHPIAIAELPSEEDRIGGFWGELEVCRRLGMLEDCGLFRPFPDNEISEVVLRRLATGATLGIQVKTAKLDQPHAYRHVLINRSTFVPSPTTVLVALAWIVPEGRFHETCLLVPTEVIPSIAGTSGPNYELHFRPDGSGERSVVDQFRLPLESLAEAISRRLG
ncbi:MAG TPA: hypothetical protein VLR46_05985 [Candidatus Dormibacteraeota bacterium]|nr:hypothetical protein [Candidatus Dormibacteraeota bacterium]